MLSKTMEMHRLERSSNRTRGSLPLKKRRFQPIKQETLNSHFVATISPVSSVLPPVQLPPSTALMPILERPFAASTSTPGTYTDDKIAALALVAAASSHIPNMRESHSTTESSSEVLSASSEEDEKPQSLLTPLPGGCHGRSSRHHSYCRRTPCYKGSNYCKLHYRQYVVRCATVNAADDGKSPRRSSSSSNNNNSKTVLDPQHQQDRRFMGNPGETRCLATTTRGRACAYISVNGTKYCYLHSDYDTNPPPRRGGCGTPVTKTNNNSNNKIPKDGGTEGIPPTTTSARLAEKKGLKKRPRGSLTGVSRPDSVPLSEVSVPSVSSSEDSGKQRKKSASRRTSAKLKEKHADSPFPLLSMISTDQWSQKKVKIAIGPFEGRTGEVKKWGNGWVCVRVPGVGLHNRRSFELYLDPDEDTTATTTTAATSTKVEKPLPSSEPSEGIFRCVSHDASSPSPITAMVTPRPIKTTLTPNDVTPKMPLAAETPRGEHGMVVTSVTPSVLQKSRVETTVPLMESLLMSAGEGPGKKFDMLFGTAALERSRRSIHKPTRYEDTEMLDKKRGREEDGVDSVEKHHRVEVTK